METWLSKQMRTLIKGLALSQTSLVKDSLDGAREPLVLLGIVVLEADLEVDRLLGGKM